ncbi:dehydrogenase [Bifidobacterium reuteri DSM 23975]|uniref:Dehydrogenase n=1 Tax=Bifidobacterium reuteri DSM 23975 TaxID=1437610 RepID=A0A087CYE5_9BIFI|nr:MULTISPECIES: SDR family NAD(P)-dependent oxidoreductase [Bifidobacterium]KFI88295.1 dehydrogenase [Bifidobacterium reuteri DSM 23975]TPF93167.1 hypothetical protein BW14_06400 [Bifidobacterium sp. UTBIF-68]
MPIAIITGASSGLGRAYIDAIIRECPEIREIWVIARSKGKLERIASEYQSVRIVPVPLDLTDLRSFDELRDRLDAAKPFIRMLVSNAGIGASRPFADEDPQRLLQLVQLNVMATTMVTRLCLPYMQRGSMILETGSILGVSPVGNLAAYSASKSYVRTLSVVLRQELKPHGIHVTVVQPGLMDTPMLSRGSESSAGAVSDAGPGKRTPLPVLDPRDVAIGSIRAVRRNKAIYLPHPFNKLLAFLAKILPITFGVSVANM